MQNKGWEQIVIKSTGSTVDSTIFGTTNLPHDYIARYKSGELIATMTTDYFKDTVNSRFRKIIGLANEVISSLRRENEYNGFYIAYILNQISQEEFDEISEKYSITLEEDISEGLKEKIRILFLISKEIYSPLDLSNIFKIDESVVEEIINELKAENLIESE